MNVLIKPASGLCDLRCRYCFYRDEMSCRTEGERGIMTPETQERLLRRVFAECPPREPLVLAYQGGEPTLAGQDYFLRAAALEKELNVRGLEVRHVIQTNGVSLTPEWASLFQKEKYLVGLSLDGPAALHDPNRPDAGGKDTHARVLRAARLLRSAGVEFNLLCVVTAPVARKASSVYDFFRRQGFAYLQFIPCLDPLEAAPGPWSLTDGLYGEFLRTLFDRWYRDLRQGNGVSIRLFDNLVSMAAGYPPESCGMSGVCVCQNVVEAEGSVYPCDFWALDEYRLGNLCRDSFRDIRERYDESGLCSRSRELPEECLACPWRPVCGGGCLRERRDGKYRFCRAYRSFLEYAWPRIEGLAALQSPRN